MKKILLTAASALACSIGAQAAPVAQYTFTGSAFTSSDTDPNSTASPITLGAGLSGATIDTSLGNPTPSLSIDASLTTGTSQGTAVSTNSYYSFILTPTIGTLSLLNLTFDYASYGTFPVENFVVRSSVDAFAGNTAASVATASGSGAFSTATVGLGAAGFQNLTSATPIEFRLYVYDSTTTTAKGALVDNIIVNPVPEPSTYAMILGGLGTMVLIYRRKNACA